MSTNLLLVSLIFSWSVFLLFDGWTAAFLTDVFHRLLHNYFSSGFLKQMFPCLWSFPSWHFNTNSRFRCCCPLGPVKENTIAVMLIFFSAYLAIIDMYRRNSPPFLPFSLVISIAYRILSQAFSFRNAAFLQDLCPQFSISSLFSSTTLFLVTSWVWNCESFAFWNFDVLFCTSCQCRSQHHCGISITVKTFWHDFFFFK